MRVILLGHRGFVGSAFAGHLASRDVELVRVDRDNRDRLKGMSADIVLEAAGSSDRPLASADPMAAFHANVTATFANCIDFPAQRYLYVSTIAVYDNPTDPRRNNEEVTIDPLALGPYGLHKYVGELIVRRHAADWVIFRLGPVVGPGIRKNSIFDLLAKRTLFTHPDSRLPYIDTRAFARIAWDLRSGSREIFNVCGGGRVRLADVAAALGVDLGPELYSLPRDDFDVNIEKLKRVAPVPASLDAVMAFAREWRPAAT